jgi:hypothetical protein
MGKDIVWTAEIAQLVQLMRSRVWIQLPLGKGKNGNEKNIANNVYLRYVLMLLWDRQHFAKLKDLRFGLT